MLGHKFDTIVFGIDKFITDSTGNNWLGLIQGDLYSEGDEIDEHTDFIKPIFLPKDFSATRLYYVQKFKPCSNADLTPRRLITSKPIVDIVDNDKILGLTGGTRKWQPLERK